jgi:hypothetical protein
MLHSFTYISKHVFLASWSSKHVAKTDTTRRGGRRRKVRGLRMDQYQNGVGQYKKGTELHGYG